MSAIKIEKTYPVPKETLWAYLTSDELLSSWCMPSYGFALEPGETFVFQMPSSAFWDGKFHNKMLDFEELVFLKYQCIAKRPKLDTIVAWTLMQEGEQTKLVLEHSGFGGKWLIKIMLAAGWKKMMNEHLYKKISEKRDLL